MREVMTLSELMKLFTSILPTSAVPNHRASEWLEALNDGPITRTVEGQTLTVTYLGRQGYEVTFK